jgi:hypothetical protein
MTAAIAGVLTGCGRVHPTLDDLTAVPGGTLQYAGSAEIVPGDQESIEPEPDGQERRDPEVLPLRERGTGRVGAVVRRPTRGTRLDDGGQPVVPEW